MKIRQLIIVTMLGSLSALAQEIDSTKIELAEIVIAENRIQLPYSVQSRSIGLVDRPTIQKSPVISVADMLHFVSGVDVRTRGANGIQADVGIRGGTFDQTLILVNGVKVSDPQTGHHSLNLPVNLRNVDRIEVLKGPGARIFGQNAFSGAINIITATPEKSYLQIGAQGGDFSLWGANFDGALVTDNQAHQLAINYDQSTGYKHNTDYTLLNAMYNGSFTVGAGEFKLMAGYTDRAFGANGFYASPSFTEQFETVQTGLAALSYNTHVGKTRLDSRIYYRQNNDEYIFVRNNPALYQNNHINKTLGVEINSVIPFKNATTGIGIDVNNVSLTSNNLGDHQRFVTSLFVEHRMEFFGSRLDITPGIQLNYYSDFGIKALPGIDLGFGASDHIRVFGSAGYTYRIPTFTDIYYTGPANIGNPDLKPEYAWNYELGLKIIRSQLIDAQMSFFYRDGKEMIDWVRATDTDPWQPVNILSLKMSGFDGTMNLRMTDFFTAKNPVFNSFSLNYTYIKAISGTPEAGQSQYALENLQHQVRFGLNLAYGPRLSHSISAGYYDRVNLDDYMTVDTRLAFRNQKMAIFLDVTNIFDATYQETNLVVMPGRWFKGGLSVNIF